MKNTGTREGAEVAQVYVGDTQTKVPRPAKELKGFVKVSLRAGETKKVSVILDSRSLSYYDINAKRWRAEPGDFNVLVGRSSEQIELQDKLTLAAASGPVRHKTQQNDLGRHPTLPALSNRNYPTLLNCSLGSSSLLTQR